MLKRNPDLRAHGQNVMETIGAAVSGLDELGVVVTILEELGSRHRMYGAKPEHFKVKTDNTFRLTWHHTFRFHVLDWLDYKASL